MSLPPGIIALRHNNKDPTNSCNMDHQPPIRDGKIGTGSLQPKWIQKQRALPAEPSTTQPEPNQHDPQQTNGTQDKQTDKIRSNSMRGKSNAREHEAKPSTEQTPADHSLRPIDKLCKWFEDVLQLPMTDAYTFANQAVTDFNLTTLQEVEFQFFPRETQLEYDPNDTIGSPEEWVIVPSRKRRSTDKGSKRRKTKPSSTNRTIKGPKAAPPNDESKTTHIPQWAPLNSNKTSEKDGALRLSTIRHHNTPSQIPLSIMRTVDVTQADGKLHITQTDEQPTSSQPKPHRTTKITSTKFTETPNSAHRSTDIKNIDHPLVSLLHTKQA